MRPLGGRQLLLLLVPNRVHLRPDLVELLLDRLVPWVLKSPK